MSRTVDILKCWVKTNRGLILLFLIILSGSFLRIYHLGKESLWLDEAFTARVSSGSFASAIVEGRQPPYFAILQPWVSLFGNSEASLRAPSAILGILCIPLVYLIGRALFNQKVGLISSLLSAISLFYIGYSQEARSYALILFLALLSYLFFILILKKDKKWYYPCYLLANIFLVYTNPVNLSIIAAQISFLLLFWTRYKPVRIKLICTQVASIVASLLGALWVLSWVVGRGGIFAYDPSLRTIYETMCVFAGGERVLLLIFLCLAVIAPLSIRRIEGKWLLRKPLESLKGLTITLQFQAIDEAVLLLTWLVVPIVGSYVVSKVIMPVYLTRYLIAASPALLLLVAKGLSNLKIALYPLLLVIVLLATPNLTDYYCNIQKEQWREVAAFIEVNSEKDDVCIFCADYIQGPFDYYYQGGLAEYGIVKKNAQNSQEIEALFKEATIGKERVWLILGHGGQQLPVKSYIVDKYGDDSILMEPQFHNVSVTLFGIT